MKTILTILLLAAIALLADLPIAGLGLALVAIVLMIGDVAGHLASTSCTHNCNQGDNCTCSSRGVIRGDR